MRVLKWFLISIASIVLLSVASIIAVGFFLSPQSKLGHADVIVAVSGGETHQRAREAVKLYKGGYAPKLLFSGAAQDKNGPSNAAAMRTIALAEGVSPKDIVIEEDSRTTAENAVQSAPIIRSLGAHSIILVTSPYHQRRASVNFNQVLGPDIKVINHSSVDSSWRKNSWWTGESTRELTTSELQKTIFVLSTKPQDQK